MSSELTRMYPSMVELSSRAHSVEMIGGRPERPSCGRRTVRVGPPLELVRSAGGVGEDDIGLGASRGDDLLRVALGIGDGPLDELLAPDQQVANFGFAGPHHGEAVDGVGRRQRRVGCFLGCRGGRVGRLHRLGGHPERLGIARSVQGVQQTLGRRVGQELLHGVPRGPLRCRGVQGCPDRPVASIHTPPVGSRAPRGARDLTWAARECRWTTIGFAVWGLVGRGGLLGSRVGACSAAGAGVGAAGGQVVALGVSGLADDHSVDEGDGGDHGGTDPSSKGGRSADAADDLPLGGALGAGHKLLLAGAADHSAGPGSGAGPEVA